MTSSYPKRFKQLNHFFMAGFMVTITINDKVESIASKQFFFNHQILLYLGPNAHYIQYG